MIKTISEAGLFRFASENFFVPGINDDPLERKTGKRRDPQLWVGNQNRHVHAFGHLLSKYNTKK